MQTFSDFISQRFGLSENFDQNQQKVPSKMAKRAYELKNIINMILENPNYFDDFFDSVKDFVHEVRDNDLAERLQNLKDDVKQDNKEKGLAQEEGISDKPNNLPPNMGG